MLMDVTKVAEKLSVSESTIRRLIDSGKLQSVKVGSQLRISDTEIDRYLKVEGRKMEAVVAGKRYKTEGSTLIATIRIEPVMDGWRETEEVDIRDLDDYGDNGWGRAVRELGKGEHDLYMTPKGSFFWVMDEERTDVDSIQPVLGCKNGEEWFDLIQGGWGKTYVPWETVNPNSEIEDA
jgi:excisionase family DNA binding protein